MEISLKGLNFIASFEKEVLHTYDDGFGYPTIGIGHLLVPGDGFDKNSRITHEQAVKLFRNDLQKYVSTVNSSVRVKLNQNQFDALCSLCFNIGREAFANSSCVKALNRGDYPAAAESLTHWNRARGQVVRGLVRRREAEKQIFLTPVKRELTPENIEAVIDDQRIGVGVPEGVSNIPDKPVSIQIEAVPYSPELNLPDIDNLPSDKSAKPAIVNAPPKEDSTKTATTITFLGFTFSGIIAIAINVVMQAVSQGFISAAQIGEMILEFATQNTKYFFLLIGLIIISMALKKLYKQITLWMQMWFASRRDLNNVEVKPQ